MSEAKLVRAGSRLRTIPFAARGEADRYRFERYRRGPQRWLHDREAAIVDEMLATLAAGAAAPRFLDVPSGFGRMTARVPSSFRTVAADLSATQARLVLPFAPAVAGNLLAGLPFADCTFDAVLCVRLLHHLRDGGDRDLAIAELARVSRGHVLLSYYEDVALWRTHRRLMEALRLRKPRISSIGRAELEERCRRAGLSVTDHRPVLRGVHAHVFVLLKKNPR